MTNELCQPAFLKHVVGEESRPNEAPDSVYLEPNCTIDESLKIYRMVGKLHDPGIIKEIFRKLARYLIHFELGVGADLATTHHVMQRYIPGLSCDSPQCKLAPIVDAYWALPAKNVYRSGVLLLSVSAGFLILYD